MILSVGGSVSTGSSPWIDILSATPELLVVKGELRIGESGLYQAISKLYLNKNLSRGEVLDVESILLGYGEPIPIPLRITLAALSRMPGLPDSLEEKIRKYRLGRRGYDKVVPGFSKHSRYMVGKLASLVERSGEYDSQIMKGEVVSLMSEYFSLLRGDFKSDNSPTQNVIIDQLVAPRLLFDELYGPLLTEILIDVKFVIVRRDPRDQFIDLLVKKKKRLYKMNLESAAKTFVDEYLPRYDRMQSMLEVCDSGRVIDIWFEDILFNLSGALNRLEYFMGRKNDTLALGCIDKDVISKKIGMYDAPKYASQMSYIEKHMWKHLYENN